MYKIQECYIDGYGIFNSKKIVLPKDSCVLIHGNNQAGKSTLFSFLRGQLAGYNSFKIKENHYEPLSGGKHGGYIKISDGQSEYTLSRYLKEKNIEIQSENGNIAEFQAQMNAINIEDYRSLFAFDLDELRTLALLEKQELSEKLFTTGLWGANSYITSIIKDLSQSQQQIVRPRGRALLTDLYEAYEELEKEVELHYRKQAEIEHHIKSYQKQKNEIDDQIKKRSVLIKEIEDLNKRAKLTNLHVTHEELTKELSALETRNFPSEDDVELCSFYKRRLRELTKELDAVQVNTTATSHANVIQSIIQKIEEIQKTENILSESDNSTQNHKLPFVMLMIALGGVILGLWLIGSLSSTISLVLLGIIIGGSASYLYISSKKFEKRLAELQTNIDVNWKKIQLSANSLGLEINAHELNDEKNKLYQRQSEILSAKQVHAKLESDYQLFTAKINDMYAKYQVDSEEAFESCVRDSKVYQSLVNKKQEFVRVAQTQGFTISDTEMSIQPQELIEEIINKKNIELQLLEEAISIAVDNVKEFEINYKNHLSSSVIDSKVTELSYLKDKINNEFKKWQVFSVCEAVLQNSFTKLFQAKCSVLLGDASQIFRTITANHFERITIDSSFSQIIVEDSHGKTYNPMQLSRGALEQLYLSLRLSLAKMYAKKFGFFPLLFDDVLVNFDKARAKTTLQALSELSSEFQVIMFTCHEWIRDLFQEVRGSSDGVVVLN